MNGSNRRLTGILAATLLLILSTASVYAEMSLSCIYDVLADSYEYLAACGVDIDAERYQTYKRLRPALKDFINLNSTPGKAQINSAYDERLREGMRVTARTEQCQGKTRQFAGFMFGAMTTEQFAMRLFDRLSSPHDPYEGDCL